MELKGKSISVPVDIIRALAIFLVVLLHAAIEPVPVSTEMTQESVVYFLASNLYNSLATVSVPLFVMLSGALLLQPFKNEPVGVFLKKRFRRIGPAFVFWGAAYFAWRAFVNGEALTVNSVVQGILQGPYFHFWFLYMIIGLYLITPLLRVFVDHANSSLLRYIIVLWFVGVAINPLIGLFVGYRIDNAVFVIAGWVGYFLLGVYLQRVQVRAVYLYLVMVLGFVWTLFGAWVMTYYVGGTSSYFFYDFLAGSVILSSAALFTLLLKVSPERFKNRHAKVERLVTLVSSYTLPVYLFHVMVLESFEKGYFGFKLSVTTLNPFVEIPLIAVLALFVSIGVVYLLKKVPVVKDIIG